MNIHACFIAAIAGILVSSSANANEAHHSAADPNAPAVNAEVRKVDKNANKITLRHDPIPNLDMPQMTMVFQVRDPKILDGLKAGDKVQFVAVKIDGAYTVIKLDPVK